MKPICVPCQRFFRMQKSGFYFTEGMPTGNYRPPSGNGSSGEWKPYKIWSGDLWQCEGCGAKIISGCGMSPIRIQHEKDFADVSQSLNAHQFQVNDC